PGRLAVDRSLALDDHPEGGDVRPRAETQFGPFRTQERIACGDGVDVAAGPRLDAGPHGIDRFLPADVATERELARAPERNIARFEPEPVRDAHPALDVEHRVLPLEAEIVLEIDLGPLDRGAGHVDAGLRIERRPERARA